MSDTERHIVSREGEAVDLAIWHRYLRQAPGLLEATLDLNPGLADLGLFPPVGTVFVMPIDKPKAVPTLPLVKLFD